MKDLEQRLQVVKERIRKAARQAGRDPEGITLVAVSKTSPPSAVIAAWKLGVRDFGENRVEEAVSKIPVVNEESAAAVTWHMIGHLQSRKVNDAVKLFDLIHSVDSVPLARRLEGAAALRGSNLPVLLEVNVSGESSKFGFHPEPHREFLESVRQILVMPHLEVQGLMTIAPIVTRPEEARPFFKSLAELRKDLHSRFPERAWQHLSMGMTDDFEVAITEGATIVRIGRAIFGERS